MSTKEVFEQYDDVFEGFGKDEWFRYYSALNAETPAEQVVEEPYYLELSEGEKICYEDELERLKEERKTFPRASYEVSYKDLD